MQFGEAFISLIPQLDPNGVDQLIRKSEFSGRRAGDAYGDGFEDSVKKRSSGFGKLFEGFGSQLAQSLDKGLKSFDNKLSNLDKTNKQLGVFSSTLATMGARATVGGAGIAAMVPSVLSLTNALIPAAGALVAYPGLLGAVKVATGVTKLAVMGFGDAVSDAFSGTAAEAEEAISKLPPQAQIAARSLLSFKTELEDLRTATSDSFFGPINTELEALGNKYLPVVQKQFPVISGAVGETAQQFMHAATNGKLFDGVNALLENTGTAINIANDNTGALADTLGSVLEVSSNNLPRLAQGFSDAASRVSEFISKAAETGKLQEWLDAGLATLRTLGQLITNVGSILFSVLKAAQSDGANLLEVLVSLTDQIADFLRTGEGMEALTATFQTFSDIGDGLRTGLAAVLPAIAQSAGIAGPVVGQLAKVLGDLLAAVAPLLPYFTQLTAAIISLLIPAVATLARFLAENEAVMKVVATAIGVVITATKLYAVYTKAAAIATAVWSVATRAAAIASNAWAAAVWLVNLAMRANPIGIVITAITALIAIIVVAYKNHEGFRAIVDKVWAAIKAAIKATVDWLVNTAWPAVKKAIDVLGDVFMWLWKNVIVPVWNGIKVAIDVAWAAIKVLFAAGQAFIKDLAAVFTWLWKNVIDPAWQGIKLAITIAWTAIKLIFGAIEVAIRAQAIVWRWIWNEVIKPVWEGIKTTIQTVWNFIRDKIFTPIIDFIKVNLKNAWEFYRDLIKQVWDKVKEILSAAWGWVKDKVLQPIIDFIKGPLKTSWDTFVTIIKTAWDRFKSDAKAVWDWVKTNVFEPIRTFITKTIPDAFSKGVGAVKSAWDKIKEIVRTPIVAVVEIINKGIIGPFNKVSGFVNGPQIDTIKFATGGVLPGYTPGRDVHRFFSPTGGMLDLSGGEAIMRPEFTRAVGTAFVDAGNQAARGGGVSGVRKFLQGYLSHGDHPQYKNGGVLAFKDGGILGGIADAVSRAWNAFTNPVETFKSGVSAMLGNIGGGKFGGILGRVVNKLVDAVSSWISEKFESTQALGGEGGPGNWQAMWNWVKSRFPQAQLYSGLRNSTTLSGAVSLHASGRAIDFSPIKEIGHAIISTFGKNITELIGPWPDMHMWHGRPHDYSDAVDRQHGVYGSNSHWHWAMRNGGVFKYDNGGWFKPGQVGVNALKRPEAVLTPDESRGLKNMSVGELADLLRELIEEVRANGHVVGGYIRGSGRSMLTKARQA